MEKLSRLCDISSKVGKCWAMCSGQAVEMLCSALSAALPRPCWFRWVQRNLSMGSSSPLWLLIHSQSSPSSSILVCLTATCVFSGRLRIASTTCGTTSFSSGNMFLATACMTNRDASVESHVGAAGCASELRVKLKNICRKQWLLPTTNTTSLINSETRARKSANSSPPPPSSTRPNCRREEKKRERDNISKIFKTI